MSMQGLLAQKSCFSSCTIRTERENKVTALTAEVSRLWKGCGLTSAPTASPLVKRLSALNDVLTCNEEMCAQGSFGFGKSGFGAAGVDEVLQKRTVQMTPVNFTALPFNCELRR